MMNWREKQRTPPFFVRKFGPTIHLRTLGNNSFARFSILPFSGYNNNRYLQDSVASTEVDTAEHNILTITASARHLTPTPIHKGS